MPRAQVMSGYQNYDLELTHIIGCLHVILYANHHQDYRRRPIHIASRLDGYKMYLIIILQEPVHRRHRTPVKT